MSNERGQYSGQSSLRFKHYATSRVGADASTSSATPWIVGGIGLAVIGVVVGVHAASQRPRLTAHEKEVRAWEAEFPGLPWYMDQVKDARQLDSWERARDYWERTR